MFLVSLLYIWYIRCVYMYAYGYIKGIGTAQLL